MARDNRKLLSGWTEEVQLDCESIKDNLGATSDSEAVRRSLAILARFARCGVKLDTLVATTDSCTQGGTCQ